MSDHWIRLRGGWDWVAETGGPAHRVTLPMASIVPQATRIRLTRAFQAPRLDPASEQLSLRLQDVPGLVQAVLNGTPISGPVCDERSVLIPLGAELPGRNLLMLDAEMPAAASLARPWGSIALVIGTLGEDERAEP